MRLVQGRMEIILADYADRSDPSDNRSRPRFPEARVRCDDGDEKDRYRCHRGGAPWLRLYSSCASGNGRGIAAGVGLEHVRW